MAKAGYLSKNVLEVIAGVYRKHKDWKAKQVLNAANEILASDGLNSIALSTVQRELAKYHKKEKEQPPSGTKPIDTIWSIGVLTDKEYELPLESVPIVLEMANWRIRTRQLPLTIREALWVSRLYPVIARLISGRQLSEVVTVIDAWVDAYTTRDVINEMVGYEKLNTSVLDWGLWESRGDYKRFSEEHMHPPPDFENPLKEMTPEEIGIVTQAISSQASLLSNEVPGPDTEVA